VSELLDILKESDPRLAKLLEVVEKIKRAKALAEKIKIMCEAELITDELLCRNADAIAILPPEQQKRAIVAMILRSVLAKRETITISRKRLREILESVSTSEEET